MAMRCRRRSRTPFMTSSRGTSMARSTTRRRSGRAWRRRGEKTNCSAPWAMAMRCRRRSRTPFMTSSRGTSMARSTTRRRSQKWLRRPRIDHCPTPPWPPAAPASPQGGAGGAPCHEKPGHGEIAVKAGLLPKLLISPSALLVLVCVYGYMMFTCYLSFTNSTMMPSNELVGMANYRRLAGLENWWVAVANLGVFATLYLGFSLLFGLGLALLIDQKIRCEGVLRSIFLYPMALSFIVTGTAWKWLLDPGVGLERSLHGLGWESFDFGWIKDSQMAIYCVVIAAVWQTAGFVMAMFLAGLRGVDTEQVNAARVDGARIWQIYLHIIVPPFGRVFVSSFVILAHMAIKSYDLVIALTNGGPGRSTWLPSVFMYQYTYTRNEMAVGAASSVLMLLALAVVVLPYLYSEMKKVKNG